MKRQNEKLINTIVAVLSVIISVLILTNINFLTEKAREKPTVKYVEVVKESDEDKFRDQILNQLDQICFEDGSTYEMDQCGASKITHLNLLIVRNAPLHTEIDSREGTPVQIEEFNNRLRNNALESEQALRDYIDARCTYEMNYYYGGTIMPLIYSSCEQEILIDYLYFLQSDKR